MSKTKSVFEGGTEYRVFKERLDLARGESIELPEYIIPLTVEQLNLEEIYFWFLCPVEPEGNENKEDKQNDGTHGQDTNHKPASSLRDETDVLGGDLEI